MEISSFIRPISSMPRGRSLNPNPSLLLPSNLPSNPSPNTTLTSLTKPGLIYFAKHLPKARTSEETSTSLSDPFDNVHEEEIGEREATLDVRAEALKILDKLNVKLGSVDPYPVLVYGSGALAALWVSSAVVGAIDSIPLFPKVLEIVGLGFTVWFSYRYLIFKKNREELLGLVEGLKQEIIGSDD